MSYICSPYCDGGEILKFTIRSAIFGAGLGAGLDQDGSLISGTIAQEVSSYALHSQKYGPAGGGSDICGA